MTSLTFANIARAAIDQDWCVERTSRQHRRLIPPDKSKPIVITAGTAGDSRAVRHFLSQMRLSGFQWPWPPQRSANGRNGSIRVSTISELSGENMTDVKERLIKQQRASEEADVGDIRDEWIPVVADRPIAAGYMMNIDADVRSPAGNVLTPELKGRQLWIGFKPLGVQGYETKRSRLDKVVLLTWVGEPVDRDAQPVHINGNPLDCRPDNLRWPCDVKPIDAEPPAEPAPPAEQPVEFAEQPGWWSTRQSKACRARQPHLYEDVAAPIGAVNSTQTPVDDVSVKFILGNHGIDLVGVFDSSGGVDDYSIITDGGRIDKLSGDDLKALAAIITRWQRVADHL